MVHWNGVTEKVVVPMIVSPIVGFTLSYVAVLALQWLFRDARRSRIGGTFRIGQVIAAAAMSLGHGLQDAQKSMGVITLALVVGGYDTGGTVPGWVKVACATAIGLGTYAGGWRIMKTLGTKMIEMDPIRSTGSQGVASVVLYVMALRFAAPISTTHTITSSILGAGATRGRKWVRWGVVGNIVGAWVLTLPSAAAVAALMYGALRLLGLGG